MYRVMFFIKRKPHLTHEQFKTHFERSHAAMAIKFCGHLFLQYQRHYIDEAWYGGDSRKPNSDFGRKTWNWDLLSVWTLPSEESYHEITRIMLSPEYDPLFEADEDRFIDREATVMLPCTVADTGTVFNAKNTVFDTPTGIPSWENWMDWRPAS
jgi:EthD domain